MSQPFKNYGDKTRDKLHGAINELISANSALNMSAEPMKPAEGLEYPSNTFLSQTDHWVNHSMVHIREAINLIVESLKIIDKDETKIKMKELEEILKKS